MADATLVPNYEAFNASLPDFNNASTLQPSQAILPPVELLRTFISESFRVPVPHHFILQMEIAAAIIAVLLVMACAVVWRRWSEKSLWVVRKQERRDGVLLVPNAVTSFLILEFAFGSIWICYAADQIRVVKGLVPPNRLVLWLGLSWLPLIQGAWFAGWGTFFASPLQPGEKILAGTPPKAKEMRRGAKLFPSLFATLNASALNGIMVGVPLLHMAAITILTVVASKGWEVAVDRWSALDSRLLQLSTAAHASPDAVAAGQISEDVRQEAVAVWLLADEAMGGLGRVWWCWTASAMAFTAFYTLTGGALLLQLRREVIFLKRAIFQKMQAVQVRAGRIPVGEVDTNFAAVQERTGTIDVSPWPRATSKHSILRMIALQSSSGASSRRQSKSGLRSVKLETMKRLMHLIGVQVICISIAAGGFSLLALALALGFRRSVQEHVFTMFYVVCNLIAAWTACVFGGAIFFAITARTFEFLTEYIWTAAQNSRGGGRSDDDAEGEKGGRSGRLTANMDKSRHSDAGGSAVGAPGLPPSVLPADIDLDDDNGKGAGGRAWRSPSVSRGIYQGEDSIVVPGNDDDGMTAGEEGRRGPGLASANSLTAPGSIPASIRSMPNSPHPTSTSKVKWLRSPPLGIPLHDRTVWQDDSIVIEDRECEEDPPQLGPPRTFSGRGDKGSTGSEAQSSLRLGSMKKNRGAERGERRTIFEEDSLYIPTGRYDGERGEVTSPPPRVARPSRSTEGISSAAGYEKGGSPTWGELEAISPRIPPHVLSRARSSPTCEVHVSSPNMQRESYSLRMSPDGQYRSFGYRSATLPDGAVEKIQSEYASGRGGAVESLGATSPQVSRAAGSHDGRYET